MTDSRPHVVIVGGGFGGLTCARALKRAPVRITLIDRSNHHLFQPLLYQVATGGLNPADIAAPIRGIVRKQQNVQVLLATVLGVDPIKKVLRLDRGELSYDRLVLATGATHSYFGNDAWQRHAPGLKTLGEAIDIRHRVLAAYEAAELETDPAKRAAWQTFCVVGGGPTGVELAGALAELARHTLKRDFRVIEPRASRVVLLEAGPHILATYPEHLRESAKRQLERLGAEVRTGQRVTEITAEGVRVGGEWLPSKTVLWAAGVAASPLGKDVHAPLDRAGRVKVNPDLTAGGFSDVHVIGDLVALEQDGKPVPGVAPAAMQMGHHVAADIKRALAGKPTRPFRYTDKGSLATIGRASAIGDLGFMTLTGFPAWFAWLAIHIVFLIGFRSRVIVLFQWAWAWWTFQRGARLITVPVDQVLPPSPALVSPLRNEGAASP